MRYILPILCLASLMACQDDAPSSPTSTDDTDLQAVTATSLHKVSDFSSELAAHIPIEIGMDRDTVEAEIRGYFVTTSSSGQIPVFNSKTLPNGEFQIVATRDGLADDSVKGERLIARFSDDILTAYGMRVKCYRGPKPDVWTRELCP